MIKKLNLLALSMLCAATLFGQSDKYLRLYAIMGLQQNRFDNTLNTNINSGMYPFQLGAGSNYTFGKLVLGTEFYNANGTLKNSDYQTAYHEFTSTFYLGYNLLKSSNMALEPNIGFFMTNKKSVVYNMENQVTRDFKVNQIGISPSVTITKFNYSGISTALKVGCNIPLNNQNWNNGMDGVKTAFTINSVTPFIQLNFGGRIKLKKKVK